VKEFQTILFLCTGNFYRSRYAEAWFNAAAVRAKLQWRASSAGFRPHIEAKPLSGWAAERLAEEGIALELTRPAPVKVTEEDLTEASHIVAMLEKEHRPMMLQAFPCWVDRVEYWHVHDIDEVRPAEALLQIEAQVERLVRLLQDGHALGVTRHALVEF
jgi:protein-tyrosine phosphatase